MSRPTSMPARTGHRATPWVLCTVGLAGVLAALPLRAQDAVESVDAEGPPRRAWIEPRVSAGATLTSNGNLSRDAQSDLSLQVFIHFAHRCARRNAHFRFSFFPFFGCNYDYSVSGQDTIKSRCSSAF